ncbi:MAG: Crp/Fnr family transcriptional regulator [Planctomycetes bacterium]|nr:Crp/Fnr family transcriptional regulator [Planctomycetota bacterium]
MARILEVIERHPLFEGIPREDLADLVIDCRFRTPFKGDRVFESGEPAEFFYLVVGGEVKLSSATPSGRECVVEVIRAGETFALVSVLDGEPYPVSASALTDCAMIRIPRASFFRLLARRPELSARTTHEVAQRMRRFRMRLEEISTRTVPARVASYLLRQAEIQTGAAARGSVVDLGATREVVAAAIGTVREVFVRTIRGFERQGLVDIDGRLVSLRDPEELRDLSEDRGRRAGPGGHMVRAALREKVLERRRPAVLPVG